MRRELKEYWHWFCQVAPPCVLLPLFLETQGAGLTFMLSIVMLVLLICAVMLVSHLAKKRTRYLLRPALTLLFGAGLCFIASTSYSDASEETHQLASQINAECQAMAGCPDGLSGFEKYSDSYWIGETAGRIQYRLTYLKKGDSFKLYLSRSLDMGESFCGGAGKPLLRGECEPR